MQRRDNSVAGFARYMISLPSFIRTPRIDFHLSRDVNLPDDTVEFGALRLI